MRLRDWGVALAVKRASIQCEWPHLQQQDLTLITENQLHPAPTNAGVKYTQIHGGYAKAPKDLYQLMRFFLPIGQRALPALADGRLHAPKHPTRVTATQWTETALNFKTKGLAPKRCKPLIFWSERRDSISPMRNAKKWRFVPPFVPPLGLVPPFLTASVSHATAKPAPTRWPASPRAQHTQPAPALARCCSLLGALFT